MKKSILAVAVIATIAAPAAMAAPTVYGNVHISINDFDSKSDLDMASNTSAIGVKGSEDLGDGMKALYKVEFQFDASEGGIADDSTDEGTGGNALTQRDVWVGIKGGMGTIKLGTLSSNYKQKGGKVDSLYRTRLEGRGFLKTQSKLHNGRDLSRGRMTNLVSYTSPKMGGIQMVANTTFSNSADESTGFGLRWANKNIMAFFDTLDTAGESATKFGGKYKAKGYHVAAQMEDSEDVVGYNYMHLNAGFKIDKNNSVQVTFGSAEHATDGAQDTSSFAVAMNHKLSKMTNVYVGYGDKSSDTAASEDSVFTIGVKKKF